MLADKRQIFRPEFADVLSQSWRIEKDQVWRTYDIKNRTCILQTIIQYGRFETYGDFTYSYLLEQWLLKLAGKKNNKAMHSQNHGAAYGFDSKLYKKADFQWCWSQNRNSLPPFWVSSFPWGKMSSRKLSPAVARLALVCCEGLRGSQGAQLRLGAGTVKPTAELWRGPR